MVLLDSPFVSCMLLIPVECMVILISDGLLHISLLQLRRLDRKLVAEPNIITTSLIPSVQLTAHTVTQKQHTTQQKQKESKRKRKTASKQQVARQRRREKVKSERAGIESYDRGVQMRS